MDAMRKTHMIRGLLVFLCILFGCAGGCLDEAQEDTPASQNATATPTSSYPISKEEAREIALNDPAIQEDIRGYAIETEVRTGQMGPPDEGISYIVYIHVFDPDTGEQIITHLVAVSYEGEITEIYYLTPPKIPRYLPQNTS